MTWKGKERKPDDIVMQDPRDDDLVIPIMGPAGVGKSTFINIATSENTLPIGHDLVSRTAEIRHVTVPHPRNYTRRIVFVDTPGFDDSFDEGAEILRRTAVWLAKSYDDNMKMAGVVYLHDVSQARMLGSLNRHLTLFNKLCGDDAMKNTIFATTKWADAELDTGQYSGMELREQELNQNFWKQMLDLGARTCRFGNTKASAWKIIDLILETAECHIGRRSNVLQIQNELVELQRILPQTEVAQELRCTLKEILKLQENEAAQMEQERLEQIQQRIASIYGQLQDLKIPFEKRIMSVLTSIKAKLFSYLSFPTTKQAHPGSGSLSPASVTPSPPPRPSRSSSESSISHTQPSFRLTIMIWLEDDEQPHQTSFWVRLWDRVGLEAYMLALHVCGVHENQRIEVYDDRKARWLPARWNTPIFIRSVGQVILIRNPGVTRLADWDLHASFLLDPATDALVVVP